MRQIKRFAALLLMLSVILTIFGGCDFWEQTAVKRTRF